MKKKYLMMPLIILIIFLSCTVNSTTGMINIKNTTNATISNIRIGNTILAITLTPGANFNYYYYKTLTGRITSTGATTGFSYWDYNGTKYDYTGDIILMDGTFTLKTNYWFTFYIVDEKDQSFLQVGIMAQGKDNTIDPLNYKNWPYSDFYQQ
jgi:hypothetical protein